MRLRFPKVTQDTFKQYLCGDDAGGGMTQACCCFSFMAMIFSCCWARRCISVCRKPSEVFSRSMERVYSAKSLSPGATPVITQYITEGANTNVMCSAVTHHHHLHRVI